MDSNIFYDKSRPPDNIDLSNALDTHYEYWIALRDYIFSKYPKAIEEWNYPGAKYGWSFRIKDKKRAILYLLPKQKSFKAALVFGQKATDAIFQSIVSFEIKEMLKAARVYAEGRGIRIEVTGNEIIQDIKKLIDIKLAY
jgi:hypothetical protein